MRPQKGGLATAIGLCALLLAALIPLAPGAEALGEGIAIPADRVNVVEGASVPIDVVFGTGDDVETVQVTCSPCGAVWHRDIRFDPQKPNCRLEQNVARICRISFPELFKPTDPTLRTPEELGEPAHRTTYTATIVDVLGTPPTINFDVWLSSTHTCREGEALRSDVVLVSTSGHPQAESVRIRIIDNENGRTVFEREALSTDRRVAYHFLWEVPLFYNLGPDLSKSFSVKVQSNSKAEEEAFVLLPAFPTYLIYADPGRGDQPATDLQRTTDVRFWFGLAYFAAPQDCRDVSPARRILPVGDRDLPLGHLQAKVNKHTTTVDARAELVETVKNVEARFVAPLRQFWVNFTIPRDFETTPAASANPSYRIHIPEQELAGGNYVQRFNSSQFFVKPYTILPRIQTLPSEVERLERAEILFNLTYGDGMPLTRNDTLSDLLVEFGRVNEEPMNVFALNDRGGGLWNASVDIAFEYEPLGEYFWRLRESEDRYGEHALARNKIAETLSNIFRIVGARPVIDLKAFVNEEVVNGTGRTNNVHVTLTAIYKNGLPLGPQNVDPALGGVLLNVKKKNTQGRVLDVDSLIMTDADGQGSWVRSLRIGRSPDEAPVGTWDLEIVARDDNDPTNENITSFPFEVEPAKLAVTAVRHPDKLVRGGQVRYDVRITYPDGSLFTEEMADMARDGHIDARLERINFLGERTTEQIVHPRGLNGGEVWSTVLDATRLIPGVHQFNITGRDIHGNIVGPATSRLFAVVFNGEYRNSTTPICGAGEPAPCPRPRGSEIFALFPGAQGDKGYNSPAPTISVLRKLPDGGYVMHRGDVRITDDEFFDLTGQDSGLNHVGFFETDETTPLGTYVLFALGRTRDDRGWAGFSNEFNVTSITVDRRVVTPLPSVAEKGQQLTAIIEKRPGDVIDLAVVRSGPVTSQAVRATPTPLGTFLQWTPSRSTPSGPAQVELTGRDLFGNAFYVALGPVEVLPLRVRVQVTEEPPSTAPRGTVVRMLARLVFPDGLAYGPNSGTPQLKVLDELNNEVATGAVRFIAGRWTFDWTPPSDLDQQDLHYLVTGVDGSGNIIEESASRPFRIVPGSVRAEFLSHPGRVDEQGIGVVSRGELARAVVRFPAEITNVSAVATTGTTELGPAIVSVDGRTVQLSFPTDRTTQLVLAKFTLQGKDVHGNTIEGDSRLFQINPQLMQIRFTQQPPDFLEKGQRVVVDFVVEYPDGTRLRAGQGTPIPSLWARNTPLGAIEPKPLPRDPTTFRVTWDPPQDVRTDIPYRIIVSALDRWQNEALPASTRGFFIRDPLVPDYLPTPGAPIWALLVLGAALAVVARRKN